MFKFKFKSKNLNILFLSSLNNFPKWKINLIILQNFEFRSLMVWDDFGWNIIWVNNESIGYNYFVLFGWISKNNGNVEYIFVRFEIDLECLLAVLAVLQLLRFTSGFVLLRNLFFFFQKMYENAPKSTFKTKIFEKSRPKTQIWQFKLFFLKKYFRTSLICSFLRLPLSNIWWDTLVLMADLENLKLSNLNLNQWTFKLSQVVDWAEKTSTSLSADNS